MSKEEKRRAVPRLRFTEFINIQEWTETTLGKLGYFTGGGTPSKANNSFWEGNIPWVSSSDIFEDTIHFFNVTRFISEEALQTSATKKVPANSILLVSRVGVGKLAITKQSVCTSQDFTNFTPDKTDLAFLAYYLKAHTELLLQFSQGMAIKGFTKEDISKLSLFLPSFIEQQKIADCLFSLDELMAAQSSKLEALKAHKKGLMQALFPAEGETVPKLRFPEFRDSGEWVQATLGSAARFINGRAYKQEELLGNGKYRVLRVGNFFTNNHWYYSDLELEDDKYCDVGDLLYAWSASFGPKIWNGEKTIYHYHIWKVVKNTGINKEFLYILLDYETERIKSQSANGLGLLHITKNTIENWKCHLPKSEEEQQKIASCLSSLDALITTQTQKLEALKLHKKGLMQGLFPSTATTS